MTPTADQILLAVKRVSHEIQQQDGPADDARQLRLLLLTTWMHSLAQYGTGDFVRQYHQSQVGLFKGQSAGVAAQVFAELKISSIDDIIC